MSPFRRSLTLALLIVGNLAWGWGPATVRTEDYHGWKDCLVLNNIKVEVVVVPSIGRVMQFRFPGEEDGALWENRTLDGKTPDPKSKEWGNFGGDKTWPAPQGDWPKVTDRAWPPPTAFDSMPTKAAIEKSPSGDPIVRLESEVDPFYGIRATRWIALKPLEAVIEIRTRYTKVEGDPLTVGVWIISQLKNPVGVFAPLPPNSASAQGYSKQSDALPLDLKIERGLLSLQRDIKNPTKIGTEADTLLWVGEKLMLKISSPRVPDANYPDAGSSAEVYTNPDPLPYVELELLGPLQTLKVGETLERISTYTLLRRGAGDAETEARKILGR